MIRTSVTETSYPEIQESDALRSVRGADVEDVTTMIWQTCQLLRPKLDFVPAFPSYLFDQQLTGIVKTAPQAPEEVIAWSVIRQEPGSTGPEPFGRDREFCPRVREGLVRDPSMSNSITPSGGHDFGVRYYGQWLDTIIQFDCFAETNFEAERLVTWFMKTMNMNIPTYRKYGVSRMFFWRRLRDEFITQFRNGIIARSVQYYVRLEDVTYEQVPLIKRVDIALARLDVNPQRPLNVSDN
jgi:hypothetical protein